MKEKIEAIFKGVKHIPGFNCGDTTDQDGNCMASIDVETEYGLRAELVPCRCECHGEQEQ